jgi:hypothetical protein
MEKTDIVDRPAEALRDDGSGESAIDFANSRYCPRVSHPALPFPPLSRLLEALIADY